MNSGGQVVINTPKNVRRMAKVIAEAGVRPEIELFDSGDIALMHDLIKDGSIAHLTEKGPWIFGGEGAGVRILQREVGKLRREQAGKRGLAGLTGTGDGQNREASQSLTRRRRSDPRDWSHRKLRAGS
jgi:hypothetical protein